MTKEERIQSALKRVNRRVEILLHRYDKLKRLIINDGWTGAEEDRIWLEQFAIGVGMDICCGDFVIGENSIGVDGDYHKIGLDKFTSGDDITDESADSMDYIVSNYIDAFDSPFKAFTCWHRLLKTDGTLAFTCRNAEVFETDKGPLENRNRRCLYTPKLIKFYMHRLGFTPVVIELSEGGKSIRVAARKL